MVSEGVILPVGGVILEPIPVARVLWVKALSALDERRLLRPNSACSIAGVVVVHGWLPPVARHGGRCRSVARWGLLSPRGGGQYYAGCQGSSHGCWFWLLAADRGGWHCMAIVSSARDCVGGRRLQQRHQGKTRFAADRGGLLSLARRLQCGTSSEDGADDNSACWHDGGGCVRGWATRCCRPAGADHLLLMGGLETGQHYSSS